MGHSVRGSLTSQVIGARILPWTISILKDDGSTSVSKQSPARGAHTLRKLWNVTCLKKTKGLSHWVVPTATKNSSLSRQYIMNLYCFAWKTHWFIPKENIAVHLGCIWEICSLKNLIIVQPEKAVSTWCSILPPKQFTREDRNIRHLILFKL